MSIVMTFVVLTAALILLMVYVLIPVSNHISRKIRGSKHKDISVERNRVLEIGLTATGIIAVLLIVILIATSGRIGF